MGRGMRKPIICIDFDGVIHDYLEGWRDGVIYGELTPGFIDWALKAQQYFRLAIYSSRSGDPARLHDMQTWFWNKTAHVTLDVEFPTEKPPAFVSIDDRALTFNGDWSDYPVERLTSFKTWSQK